MVLVMILVTLLAAAPSLSASQRSFVKLSSTPSFSVPASSASPQQLTQERIDPRLSFKYRYRVEAPDTGDEKSHQEALKDGVLVGSYSVVQPDGTLRTVTYRADDTSGFKAKVHFQEGYADPLLQQQPRLTKGSVAPQAGTPLESPALDGSDIGSRLVGVGNVGDAAAPAPTPPHALAQDPAAFTSRFVVGSERFQGTDDKQSDASPSHSGTFGSKAQRDSILARGTFGTQAQREPAPASGTSGALAQRESSLASGAPDSQTQLESALGSRTSGAQVQRESTLGSGTSGLPLQQDFTLSSNTLRPHGSVIGEGTSLTAGSSVSAPSTLPVAGDSAATQSSSISSRLVSSRVSPELSAERGGTFVKWDSSSIPVQHRPSKTPPSASAVQQSHRFGSSSSGRTSSHNVQIQSSPRSGVSQAESSFRGSTSSSFSSASSPSSSSSSTSFSSSSVLQLSRAPDPFSATLTKDRVSGSHFAKKKNLDGIVDTVELAKHDYDDQTYTYRLSFFPPPGSSAAIAARAEALLWSL